MTLTVTNSCATAVPGGSFTASGGGTPQPFSHLGSSGGGACGGTLAAGASRTYNVVFRPPGARRNDTTYSRTLTIAATPARR